MKWKTSYYYIPAGWTPVWSSKSRFVTGRDKQENDVIETFDEVIV